MKRSASYPRLSYIRGQNGQRLFDDSRSYYNEDIASNTRYGSEILIRIEVPFCVSTLILTPLCGPGR